MGTVPEDESVIASELSYVMFKLMLYLWGAVSRSALYENSTSAVSPLLNFGIKTVSLSLIKAILAESTVAVTVIFWTDSLSLVFFKVALTTNSFPATMGEGSVI